MKSKIFLQLILTFVLAFPLMAATIPSHEAKDWVTKKGQNLIMAFSEPNVAKKYASLDEMFANYIEWDYIAKFVIGKHYKSMTEEQKKTYFPLFKRYAMSVYKSFPLSFGSNINFEVVSVSQNNKFTNVALNIALPQQQQNFLVEFILIKNAENIKITDIKLAEISLILAYRNRFNEMIAQNDGDIDWFLEDLEMITKSTEKTNQQKLY